MQSILRHLLIAAGLLSAPGHVLGLGTGDLDGHWCAPDERTISVAGNTVITPNGLRTRGVYTKHALSFIEPGENGAQAAVIWMEPKGKDAVRVSFASADQKEPPPHDLWTRCRTTS